VEGRLIYESRVKETRFDTENEDISSVGSYENGTSQLEDSEEDIAEDDEQDNATEEPGDLGYGGDA
jgi:hypothetical protein